MIIIHAHMTVKPEQIEAFLEKAKPLVEGSQAEAGNISYDLFRHVRKDNTFIVVEEWKDLEAIEFHNHTPHFTGFFAQAGEFLQGPSQVKRFAVEKEV